MIAAVLLVLALAFALSIWILGGAHRTSYFELSRGQLIKQFASVVKLIESSPEEYYPLILRASRSNRSQLNINDTSLVTQVSQNRYAQRLTNRLNESLDQAYTGRIRIEIEYREHPRFDRKKSWWDSRQRFGKASWKDEHGRWEHFKNIRDRSLEYLNISIQLHSGQWLNFQAAVPDSPTLVPRQTIIFLLLAGVCLLLVIIFLVRRITRPLQKLASAANRLGLGENIEPLAEEGPEDIRETITAFNRMNERLQRFVSDRTRMLAALSHDLRTPLTTMRLRVEMMEDSSDRDRLLSTLEEMLQMSEATLAFARQASENEPTRNVELNALLDSLCEDLAELGQDVQFAEGAEAIVACRLVSLKRAFRNLIENAVRYGQEARISIDKEEDSVRVTIQDSGPGIPEDKIEQVFEPFFRLEESRNRETGGVGLGMSIARNIIHSHGGDIGLQNREEGLKVVVTLPCK